MSEMLRRVAMLMAKPPSGGFTYATWNPADKSADFTLSNGNKTATGTGGIGLVRSTIGKSSGKWYWEVVATNPNNLAAGVCRSTAAVSTSPGSTTNSAGYSSNGTILVNGASVGSYGGFGAGQILGFALDMDGLTLQFRRNNSLIYTATVPAGTMFAAVGEYVGSSTIVAVANFGATALTYSPPAGYNAGLYT